MFDQGAGIEQIDVHAAKERVDSGQVVVLDVRNPDEWYGETGHIEGAILIPIDALPMNLDKLAPHKDKEVVCFCAVGQRSQVAAQILQMNGFKKLSNVVGGMFDWFDAGYPTVENNQWPNVK